MGSKTRIRISVAIVIIIAIVTVDQLIKHWAQTELIQALSIPVIPNLFYLTYVQNTGAAFGILQGKTMLLSVLVAAIIAGALYVLISGKIKPTMLIFAASLVLGGGIGNLIDRIRLSYVIDYLDFSALFGFPVFNFADCCVVSGTILIVIYMMFFEKKTRSKQEES